MEERHNMTKSFFETWLKIYDATYGGLLKMPAVGPMRERQEKLTKTYTDFIDLSVSMTANNINFQTTFFDAMLKAYNKSLKEIQNSGIKNKDFYDNFYDIWIETYSNTFKEYLRSDKFSSEMGKLMSSATEFQKDFREIIEENILKQTGIPTRKDFDDVNKELYIIKKSIKGLTNELIELRNKLKEKEKLISELKEKEKLISELKEKVKEKEKEM